MSRQVVKALRHHGYDAFWVGGCVRDELLKRPVKDQDVATNARPEQVAALFPGARLVGAHLGVTLVRDGSAWVEVATYRRDHEYVDGRRPTAISYANDAAVDVRRRDFTINGLLQDPETGEVFDFVDGRKDLKRRLVRAIGNPVRRFAEDRLRMLRAVRIAAALGFAIEEATVSAIRAAAPALGSVASERIRDELERILTEGGVRRGFELLAATGLLEVSLPEVAAMRGVEQPPEFHPEGDVWGHTLLVLEALEQPSRPLAWGALLHDVGKPDTFRRADRIRFDGHVERGVEITRQICERLRFSNADRAQVLALVGNHMKFRDVRRMRPGKLKRFVEQPRFKEHLALHRADCLASHGQLDNHAFAEERFERALAEKPRPRLLTGADLIQAGYRPGPQFGIMLSLVEEEQLEGRLADRGQAMMFVSERFPLGAAAASAK